MSRLLDTIANPHDLKQLNDTQLVALCDELRRELIDVVSANGGHLASNLGMVELSVALHRVFDCPRDSLVFDVGHQCYVHKLLTGRRQGFHTLRRRDGISGFTRPDESEYDLFVSGHASTSLSSAIGLARAKALSRDDGKVVAVIGDGSFGGGMVYEAINNIDESMSNLIVVLNDNSMSISKSVGAISRYLLRLRTDAKYSRLKHRVKQQLGKTGLGRRIARSIERSKSSLRRALYDGTLFEELGFNYIGPIDGHDMHELTRILTNAKRMDGPILIHAITTKGKGYPEAEENPGAYHGVGSFDKGNPDISLADSFSSEFGAQLLSLAQRDDRICAVTAAMKYATGLNLFAKSYPERFFDVGIAEEHAVTFCGGLARGGMLPVFCVYSTFLQRSFDQLIHDVSLGRLSVLLGIDRAGLVGEDGETHQGIYDVSMLRAIGGYTVAAPCNYEELGFWLQKLMPQNGPRAVRYPRGAESAVCRDYRCTGQDCDLISVQEDVAQVLLVSYGREFEQILGAQAILKEHGVSADLLKINRILPFPDEAVEYAIRYKHIVFAEESAARGGIGEELLHKLEQNDFAGHFRLVGIENTAITQATVAEQLKMLGLDAASLADTVMSEVGILERAN